MVVIWIISRLEKVDRCGRGLDGEDLAASSGEATNSKNIIAFSKQHCYVNPFLGGLT